MTDNFKNDFFEVNHHSTLISITLRKQKQKGAKAKLAHAINCQASYLSLVLNKKANLNLEQGEAAARYFMFNPDETEYLLLLIEKDRAGTTSLKKFFTQKIEVLRARRMLFIERIGKSNELHPEHQAIYYSSWIYSAIHIALTIPELKTPLALHRYLGIPLENVLKSLEFLESIGLCLKVGDEYQTTKNQVRISKESNHILKHHTNWRLRAIDSLDAEQPHELHYSGVFSATQKDVLKIKDLILENLKEYIKQIQISKEEELFVMCIDLFDLNSNKS